MAKVEAVAERMYRDELVEAEFIAYMLRKKPMLVTKVEPDWFGSEVHKNIVTVQKDIKAMVGKSTLFSELKNRKLIGKGETKLYQEAVNDIYAVSVGSMNDKSAKLAINRIIEMFEGRSILYGIREIAGSLKSMSVTDLKNRMKEMGAGVKLPEEIASGDYVVGFNARLDAIHEKRRLIAEGKDVGMTTGIRMFDTMVGGLMRAEWGVIAGQPGVGKSAMLGSIAKHAWLEGHNVVIVTGEMPKIDFEFRLDADLAGIPATKYRFGNLTKGEILKWKKSIDRQLDLRDNFLEIVSFPRNFTAADIEGHVLQIQEQYEKEVELICLDYLNIMNAVGSKYGAKDWQGQAEVAWDVKSMCADLNGGICLWTAGQLRDEGIDAEVLDLSLLKYARAISETAPIVVGLVRSQDDEAENILEMQVLKMRNAPLPEKSIILRPNLEFMRIHEELVPKRKNLLETQDELRRRPPAKKKQHRRQNDG